MLSYEGSVVLLVLCVAVSLLFLVGVPGGAAITLPFRLLQSFNGELVERKGRAWATLFWGTGVCAIIVVLLLVSSRSPWPEKALELLGFTLPLVVGWTLRIAYVKRRQKRYRLPGR